MTVPYEDAGDLPDGGLLPSPPSPAVALDATAFPPVGDVVTQHEEPCDCCEINDYDGEDYGPCDNCGHSVEEHS